MTHTIFPDRIETRRLRFEPLRHETIDPFAFYEFTTRDGWQGEARDAMPWFRFRRIDEVFDFIDHAEQEWTERNCARYVLHSTEEDVDLIGTTAYIPDWTKCRASSDIVLAEPYWGREYGLERAAAFVELTFQRFDLEAYYTACAADNRPSRRMIEKLVEVYGGQYEGLLRQQGSPRPDGEVTDQHRFSIIRDEYERATQGSDEPAVEATW